MGRASYLSTYDYSKLNDALVSVEAAFQDGWVTYLVGSVLTSPDFRDVDVRVILSDDEFDYMFAGRPVWWQVVCRSIAAWVRDVTKLPVDFQIQRQSEANEKYDGRRHPIGRLAHEYAGGGDATGGFQVSAESGGPPPGSAIDSPVPSAGHGTAAEVDDK